MREKGYTLVELLLYVTLLGSLLIAVSMFFAMATDARVKNQSIAEVDQQGTAVMEYIAQTIRNADSVTSPAVGASGSSLTLVVPTGSLSPTVFNVSGTTLQVTEGAAAAVALTNSKVQVTSLTFKNLSRASTPGVVQVSFTLSRVNSVNRNEYSYQKNFITSVSLR